MTTKGNDQKPEVIATGVWLAPKRKRRFLIHLEIANQHRLHRSIALAETLIAGGHEAAISYEPEIAYRMSPTSNQIYYRDSERSVDHARKQAPALQFIPLHTHGGTSVEALEDAQARRSHEISKLINSFEPSYVIIWGGDFEYQRGTRHGIKNADTVPKTIFFEVGWLPQQDFLYFDTRGVNRSSTLVDYDYPMLLPYEKRQLKRAKEQFWNERVGVGGPTPRKDSVFVPLQIETDTSFRLGSPFQSNADFIRFLERWLPDGLSATLKLHPKDHSRNYPPIGQRRNFRVIASGSLDSTMVEAEYVIGLNSTVLIEALMLGKHPIAFGQGLFTGSGAIIEANIDARASDVLPQRISDEARDRFLFELIFRRQVSLRALERRDYSHLASREPFESILEEAGWNDGGKKWLAKLSKGEAMIKVGNSRVAKTALLDVEKGGEIVIGDDSQVRHGAVLEVSGRYNGSIRIGNHSVIGVGSWLQGSGKIDIGNDVIIGPYATIVSTNHQYEDTSVPIAQQPLTTGEITIEDGVWMGAHVTVALNVKIGAHSIIGANSFVNKDIPPYSIAVGSPARIVRNRKPE
ncbi:hypothetical protein [Rhizobium giardinii]|uniref:capsular polysaccharide export protein, LipB/KpsS family n=1 Tax=Rhizobium giardinii TaxID=56731 RepID=UPI003D6F3E08